MPLVSVATTTLAAASSSSRGGNITPNEAMAGSTYNITIKTLDSQDVYRAIKNNPAIVRSVSDNLKNRGVLASTIRGTT